MSKQSAAFTPRTPDLDAIFTDAKAKETLAASAPVIQSWEGAVSDKYASFRELGALAAQSAVSLVQVAQAFASGIVAGLFTTSGAKHAYDAYVSGWNERNATLDRTLGGRMLPTSGDSYNASLSMFTTFGEQGAVCQGVSIVSRDTTGAPSKLEWSPFFYERIVAAYDSLSAEDGRVESLYAAFVACNRIARDIGKAHIGGAWEVRALTDEEILDACVKKSTPQSQIARLQKALAQAGKIAGRISPDMLAAVQLAVTEVGRLHNVLVTNENAADAAQAKQVLISKAHYQKIANGSAVN